MPSAFWSCITSMSGGTENFRTSSRCGSVGSPELKSMLPDLSSTSPRTTVGRRTVSAVIGTVKSSPVSTWRTVMLPLAVSPSAVPV